MSVSDVEFDFMFVVVIGMCDFLRLEFMKSVCLCCRFGVVVKMVIGDSLFIVIVVVRRCGIFDEKDMSIEVMMMGEVF